MDHRQEGAEQERNGSTVGQYKHGIDVNVGLHANVWTMARKGLGRRGKGALTDSASMALM